ncbi:MAG: hypothetical protein CVU60_01510 [Deltaproteobacteria bacterium HGW-Deltaproteobacteria-18]|nr:MAG: hypothetical protein CVU60_01510 [Deltaproteobacteria bacterium HGW-Deltaproteobacteria-18]
MAMTCAAPVDQDLVIADFFCSALALVRFPRRRPVCRVLRVTATGACVLDQFAVQGALPAQIEQEYRSTQGGLNTVPYLRIFDFDF